MLYVGVVYIKTCWVNLISLNKYVSNLWTFYRLAHRTKEL